MIVVWCDCFGVSMWEMGVNRKISFYPSLILSHIYTTFTITSFFILPFPRTSLSLFFNTPYIPFYSPRLFCSHSYLALSLLQKSRSVKFRCTTLLQSEFLDEWWVRPGHMPCSASVYVLPPSPWMFTVCITCRMLLCPPLWECCSNSSIASTWSVVKGAGKMTPIIYYSQPFFYD